MSRRPQGRGRVRSSEGASLRERPPTSTEWVPFGRTRISGPLRTAQDRPEPCALPDTTVSRLRSQRRPIVAPRDRHVVHDPQIGAVV
ncbi:hypothetical protein ACFPM0_13210 [Pseudonocardia sulfidoxydans]|uniref:hypothetical protein n=1 Tax=Pseudonocardia sulfidoxydans TaxID=54011 RepID=UPI00361F2B29